MQQARDRQETEGGTTEEASGCVLVLVRVSQDFSVNPSIVHIHTWTHAPAHTDTRPHARTREIYTCSIIEGTREGAIETIRGTNKTRDPHPATD